MRKRQRPRTPYHAKPTQLSRIARDSHRLAIVGRDTKPLERGPDFSRVAGRNILFGDPGPARSLLSGRAPLDPGHESRSNAKSLVMLDDDTVTSIKPASIPAGNAGPETSIETKLHYPVRVTRGPRRRSHGWWPVRRQEHYRDGLGVNIVFGSQLGSYIIYYDSVARRFMTSDS